jgi:hypothetical protein
VSIHPVFPYSATPSLDMERWSGTLLFDDRSSHTSARSLASTVLATAKKDRNIEKTRTRTLSVVKGREPCPIHNKASCSRSMATLPPQPRPTCRRLCKSVRNGIRFVRPLSLVHLFSFHHHYTFPCAETSRRDPPFYVFSRSSRLCRVPPSQPRHLTIRPHAFNCEP